MYPWFKRLAWNIICVQFSSTITNWKQKMFECSMFFPVSNNSLKLMFKCRIVLQFWFFNCIMFSFWMLNFQINALNINEKLYISFEFPKITSIYTWYPLSLSHEHPKVQVKRILVAQKYASKLQNIPITLEIPISCSQDHPKVQVKRIRSAQNSAKK